MVSTRHPLTVRQHAPDAQSVLLSHLLRSGQDGWHAGGWQVGGVPEHAPDSQSPGAPHGALARQSGEQAGGSHWPAGVDPQPPTIRQHDPDTQSPLPPHGAPSRQLGWQAGAWQVGGVPLQTAEPQSPLAPQAEP